MKKKNTKIAVATLAGILTAAVSAKATLPEIKEFHSKTMCVPVSSWNSRLTVQALCDAKGLNKKYKLKVDEDGCALPDQSIENGMGSVFDQASYSVWADSKKELAQKTLPECEDYEAAAFVVEL